MVFKTSSSARSLVGALAFAATSILSGTAGAVEISITQWGASLYGAPVAVAIEQGDFKKAGIDVTGVVGSGGGGTSVRNILASEVPYGEVATAAALAAPAGAADRADPFRHPHGREASLVTMPNRRSRVSRTSSVRGRDHLARNRPPKWSS